jgi:hypothetical protein
MLQKLKEMQQKVLLMLRQLKVRQTKLKEMRQKVLLTLRQHRKPQMMLMRKL